MKCIMNSKLEFLSKIFAFLIKMCFILLYSKRWQS